MRFMPRIIADIPNLQAHTTVACKVGGVTVTCSSHAHQIHITCMSHVYMSHAHHVHVTRPLQLLAAHYEHYARYYEGGMLDGTVNLAAEEKLCSALTVYRLLDSLAKKVRVLRGDLSLGS